MIGLKVRPLSSRTAGIIGFGGAVAVMVASVSLAASNPPSQAPAASTPPSAAGDMAHAKATFETLCSGCHEPALATDARYSRKGWEAVIERMYGFGLSATEAQAKEVVDYLSATYPAD